jgi:hypothetical protein
MKRSPSTGRRFWRTDVPVFIPGASNAGFVSAGVDHDTPVFAVTSSEAWRFTSGGTTFSAYRQPPARP